MRNMPSRPAIMILLAAVVALSCPAACRKPPEPASAPFAIGINRSLKSAPFAAADVNGYFLKHGIPVDVTVENSATALFDGLHSGSYDLICVPEYQAVVHAFVDGNFRIISVLNRNQTRSLVYDSSAASGISGLAGKRVGLARNSAAEYTLYRALLVNGVDERTVRIEYFAPEELPAALADKDVDAIISWEPFTTEALRLAGRYARTENAHYGRDMYWLLVARDEVCRSRSDDLVRLLEALEESIALINRKQSGTVEEIASSLSLSPDSLILEWDDYSFNLELPQSLLVSMEQEAAWYRIRFGKDTAIPDFLDVIDSRPLSAIRPRAVSIAVEGGSRVP